MEKNGEIEKEEEKEGEREKGKLIIKFLVSVVSGYSVVQVFVCLLFFPLPIHYFNALHSQERKKTNTH